MSRPETPAPLDDAADLSPDQRAAVARFFAAPNRRATRGVVDALRTAGIDVIVLKGVATQQLLTRPSITFAPALEQLEIGGHGRGKDSSRRLANAQELALPAGRMRARHVRSALGRRRAKRWQRGRHRAH